MNKTYHLAFSFLLVSLSISAYADYDDTGRSLIMKCDYTVLPPYQYEHISISQSTQVTEADTKPASTIKFKRSTRQKPHPPFLVKAHQAAECIYPSGTRVRIKVGEGRAYAYGECGGNPEIFMSFWVNRRKIASKAWVAGHCIDERHPAVSFEISGTEKGVHTIQKCHTARELENVKSSIDKKTEPLSVCVDFPKIDKFERDFIEYPRKGVKLPKMGTIQILQGSDTVCKLAQKELKKKRFPYYYDFDSSPNTLLTPIKICPASIKLHKQLYNVCESVFDFNNDGKLDRIFRQSIDTHYMSGSVLLVQPGSFQSKLKVSNSPMDKNSRFYPCHIHSTSHKILDCPPFGDRGDYNIVIKGRTKEENVYFMGRYSNLALFFFSNTTFLGVTTMAVAEQDYAAVLKPLPNGKFQQMCLLRRVPENF